MGVIDLDARVKKLEQDGTGGAVIDQLEAAVTDLEETVNGNGETDFGLVGDVAALETAVGNLAQTDQTAKFTANSSLTFSADGPVVRLITSGDLAFFNFQATITAGASAAGSDTLLGELDESVRPAGAVSVFSVGDSNSSRSAFIGTDGSVKWTSGGWGRFQAFWTIATT